MKLDDDEDATLNNLKVRSSEIFSSYQNSLIHKCFFSKADSFFVIEIFQQLDSKYLNISLSIDIISFFGSVMMFYQNTTSFLKFMIVRFYKTYEWCKRAFFH